MKAITLHQPWATLVAIGAKRFETRAWAADYQGPLAIHAGRNTENLELFEQEPFHLALMQAGYRSSDELPLGAIVGVVTLGECLPTDGMVPQHEPEASFGNFGPGRFAWTLTDPKQVGPVWARGYQKLWDWDAPPEIVALVGGGEYKRPCHAYWVTSPNGGVCVFGADPADVRLKCVSADRFVTSVQTLPYPASPQLNPEDNTTGCPPFCHSPRKCAGHGACPWSYACSE